MATDKLADGQKAPPAHLAGAYGFSRNELRALIVIGLIAGGWILYEWYDRRANDDVPAWVIEDVNIGPTSAPGTEDSSASVTYRESARPRGARGPDDLTDPGHVLIDVNSAGRRELIRLPGIGEALADRIIADREQRGPFANLQDFQRVRGIGPKTAAMLSGWVRFTQGESAPLDSIGERQ